MEIANEIEAIPVDWKDRPVVKQYNGKNELVVRTYGQTEAERLEDHLNGNCDMWCEYCYKAAMAVINEDPLTHKEKSVMRLPELTEAKDWTCPVCGGSIVGDEYNIPAHCENVEVPMDAEADSGPYYCPMTRKVQEFDNLWDIVDVPF